MNNKMLKIISTIMILLIVLLISMTTVYASNPVSGISPNTGTNAAGTVKNIGNNVLGIIQIAGTAIAVGMLLYLGIKYMLAAPEEKASIKKSSTIYLIGAVVLFAAVNIVSIIYTFATETIKQ